MHLLTDFAQTVQAVSGTVACLYPCSAAWSYALCCMRLSTSAGYAAISSNERQQSADAAAVHSNPQSDSRVHVAGPDGLHLAHNHAGIKLGPCQGQSVLCEA